MCQRLQPHLRRSSCHCDRCLGLRDFNVRYVGIKGRLAAGLIGCLSSMQRLFVVAGRVEVKTTDFDGSHAHCARADRRVRGRVELDSGDRRGTL